MSEENAPIDANEPELPAIDFQSPGRFAVHNPDNQPGITAESREPAPFVLGSHVDLERFSRPEQAQAHALALLLQARQNLCLYSPDLEAWLYSHSSVQQACTQFLLASPKNRLRILVRDVGKPVRQGHRLLNLARRITSNLHIRRINPDHPADECAYLLADDRGLLLREQPEQYAGYALYNDPGRVRQRQAQFDQAWDLSLLDPDLRSFLL
ncbi:histone acetyltransferase HPA2 [Aquipseudomonas alcaligenes]|uniref:Histone acetyltransferase HPA2 n=1 Tax=Aquipseudomonas alcaligenes TaxID=43263 RepID=A0A2V4KLG9_AQUAC|nr:histone acetyltransferase HPA2 [Pseudomonas alcaligenes]PYC20978.1 histone acetyltransferase HPA2 [Pseudomonas alcaligenes]